MWMSVEVNGHIYEREVAEHWTLLRFLHEDLALTGTKDGCSAGECGACTVMLNGRAVNACMVLAVEVDGAQVETIEAEAVDGELSAIQAAFARNYAVQCGYCTGGMVMSVRELLRGNPKPTVAEIKDGDRRKPVPVHRLPADHRGRARRLRPAQRRNERGSSDMSDTTITQMTHVGENGAKGRRHREADRWGRVHERHGSPRNVACPGEKEPARPGKVLAIDTSKAENLPGVHAVLTGEELDYRIGLYVVDKPILAKNFVRHHGEAVAAVAAESLDIASRAVELIDVEYEVLPPVLSQLDALEDSAPRVHPDLGSYEYVRAAFSPQPGTNVPNVTRMRKGDIDAGLCRGAVDHRARIHQPFGAACPVGDPCRHRRMEGGRPGDHLDERPVAPSP